MKFLDLIAGRAGTAIDPDTAESVAAALVPSNLPAHVATLAKAEKRRAALSEIEEHTPPGPALTAWRAAARALDNLISRLRLRARLVETQQQAETDARAAERAIGAARKERERRAAESVSAQAELQDTQTRLDNLLGARERLRADGVQAIAEAERALHEAIANGDDAAERSAAAALRAAREGGDTAEHAELAVRIDAVNALLTKRRARAEEAESALRTAERALAGAHIDLAGVRADAMVSGYALAMVGLQRAVRAAQLVGDDGAQHRAALAAHDLVFRDRGRVWFAGQDERKAGSLPALATVGAVVRMLDEPLDIDALTADGRQVASDGDRPLLAV